MNESAMVTKGTVAPRAAGRAAPALVPRLPADRWRAIYAANRAAIGDNPNLIHIGLTLELPLLVAQP